MNIDVKRYYELSLKERVRHIAGAIRVMEENLNDALRGHDFYFKVDIDYIRYELGKIESEFKKVSQLDQFLAERSGNKE